MKSKFAGSCSLESEHKWEVGDEIFISKGSKGEWIKCIDKSCFLKQGGTIQAIQEGKRFQSTKFPITDAPKMMNLAEEILKSFLSKRKDVTLNMENQAIFIESVFRTLSSNYKP